MSVIELPTALKPSLATDPTVLARIAALHSYANSRRGYVTEGWATTSFKRTYAVAYALCQDAVDSITGFEMSYAPERGEHICVTKSRGYGALFCRDLPLAGDLAEAFMADLDDLAMERAVADQKRDEDEQLRLRARQRLSLVVASSIRRPVKATSDD